MKRGPLVLVVLDGWGLREEREYNAIKLARTPNYLELLDRFPHTSLITFARVRWTPCGSNGQLRSRPHDDGRRPAWFIRT
jgi:2,3-bisphosphoglycerate-independent phosphoglycerate mutase